MAVRTDNDIRRSVSPATRLHERVHELGVDGGRLMLRTGSRADVVVEMRQAARASKDWALADELRDQINELGYEVEDRPDGPRLIQKKG